MIKMKKTFWALGALGACAVLIGCSSTPPEESKGVQAGDGSQKPTMGGATSAGGGAVNPQGNAGTGQATSPQ